MLSVPDQDLSNFLEKLTEEERNEMQEAFDHFHKSKEWNMICIIYEAGDCLDIVIRDEEEHRLPLSLWPWLEEIVFDTGTIEIRPGKTAGTGTREKRSVTCRTIEENLQMGYYLSRSTNGDMQGWNNHSPLTGRSGTHIAVGGEQLEYGDHCFLLKMWQQHCSHDISCHRQTAMLYVKGISHRNELPKEVKSCR